MAASQAYADEIGADGYARAGGDIGTALVVPGPGLLNAAAGLSTAYSASSPVLMLSGQIPREQIGKDIGLLHEVNDQLDCIAPVTKWRRRVLQVPDIPAAVIENGTRTDQHVVMSTLENIAADAARARIGGPALIVIGTVVGLRERLSWFGGGVGERVDESHVPAEAVQP